MKKDKMITRTIESTVATCVTFNLADMKSAIENIEVAGTYKDSEAVLKAVKAYESDYIKIVAVQSYEVKEVFYGMPESVFMQYAQVLPPRKVYKNDDVDA